MKKQTRKIETNE